MKKLFLGALLVVGSMTYAAQENKVIEVITGGAATASVPVQVSGEIYDSTKASLAVEIDSAQNPDGLGFALRMPDMFVGETKETSVSGQFRAYISKGNEKVAFGGSTIAIGLKAAGATGDAGPTITGSATSKEKVKIDYAVSTISKTDKELRGEIKATLKPETGVTAGTYADNSAFIEVKLTGYTEPTPGR